MEEEFYKKYRPKSFKAVLGQAAAVESLVQMVKENRLPHTLLFTGPSGCGKTTLARILKKKLGCSDSDFKELNAADNRGIADARRITMRMNLSPMGGGCRIYLIDEAHQLTKDAQSSFLKPFEDTPKHVYFILCTTDPSGLLETIRTRCTEIKLQALPGNAMEELVRNVCEKEGKELSEDVVHKIVEASNGSARKALVILHQVFGLQTEAEQEEAVNAADSTNNAINLVKLLLKPKASWSDVSKCVKTLKDDPEAARRIILGYTSSVMLNGAKGAFGEKLALILEAFRDNYYDSGKAGLVLSCWEVVTSRQ